MLETTTKAEEWARLKTELQVGQIVEGKILAHWPFGCFVDLGKSFVGLIEIPNFKNAGERMTAVEFPPLGARVRAKILQFVDANFQVRLSARPNDLAE